MAEGTFEFECMRAELMGLEKPNKEEFQMRLKQMAEAEFQDSNATEAQMLENQDEVVKNMHGKMDEMHNILASTKKKIIHLKQITISLSNIFTMNKTRKEFPTTAHSDTDPRDLTVDNTGDNVVKITSVNETLQKGEIVNPGTSFAQLEKQKKVSAHLDKLDLLINKAESAEISMSEQTKQMRKLIK